METLYQQLSIRPKPVLKWIGGKTQIISTVMKYIPVEIKGGYHEPFLGGGSVLFTVLSDIPIHGKIYASDININLINMYKSIQQTPDEFLKEVSVLFNEYNNCRVVNGNKTPKSYIEAKTSKESYYYYIRNRYNTEQSDLTILQTSGMFLFLNKTCFRGIYREGPNGFNVPFGNYSSTFEIDSRNILLVSKLIKDVIFTAQGYEESLGNVKDGDFVYLDPPYVPVNKKSFTRYTVNDFKHVQHENLFELVKTLVPNNVKILMSNSDTKIVRDTFKHLNVIVVECKRRINSKNPASIINEVLVYN